MTKTIQEQPQAKTTASTKRNGQAQAHSQLRMTFFNSTDEFRKYYEDIMSSRRQAAFEAQMQSRNP